MMVTCPLIVDIESGVNEHLSKVEELSKRS
jgi:hypothetical protein